MTTGPVITLTTDFGQFDAYVGAVRGVLIQTCPGAQLVDISHEIEPHDILHAAFVLAAAYSYFPAGTVHLAVVDPGVGSARREIVVSTQRHTFVGPDNGLFTAIYDREAAVVRAIENRALLAADVHPTFHGRDLFAPVAARLAAGLHPADVGPIIADPVRLAIEAPHRTAADRIDACVLHVDRFGNLVTNITRPALERLAGSERPHLALPGAAGHAPFAETYSEVPDATPFFYWGSSGYLEIAINRARADAALGVVRGDRVGLVLV
ncbi:MAG: SAM-dependent chlorinase/fluorinase [Acidobacteria bacterium]|nr:SAM-dependent chlorinase/fluorinase [Acidobacteriota bacterium]